MASLGRRVGDLRAALDGLRADRASPKLRDDLRRRVHALSAGARLLRFDAMATALAECERRLEQAASIGGLDAEGITQLREAFDELPGLAWGEPTHEQRVTELPPPPEPVLGEARGLPSTTLVIGPPELADALIAELARPGDPQTEVERTETASGALELARALAPDVAVVDADIAGGGDLVTALLGDPLTEPMPLVVVGTFSPERAAKLLSLGAARALPKPISPGLLRRACAEVASAGKPNVIEPFGELTVEELAERLADELRRGLSFAVSPGASGIRVPLGDGAAVLAATWGALARVRELVTIESGGAVTFAPRGPEGAWPIASLWEDGRVARTRGAPAKLAGRRIVVADDDPAVTWFLAGVLRAAGATVFEAPNGKRALELCCLVSPHLVVTDILMPELDGFALSRALERDIALRDVPVVLLSWKEDLLQRLRELGADADAYLRKDVPAATVVERIGEVLRTRARIEARLAEPGEVRGRLDGLTVRSLLEIVAASRPDARLSVRDASFLFELELRGGAPKSVTRTAPDGAFQRGAEVFAALLGVRAGRFVLASSSGPVRAELEGDLATQLTDPLARARAAMRVLSGTRLLEVQRIDVALDRVEPYLHATPEPVRSIVERLAAGASPRTMIVAGEVAPRLLEDVLTDLAAHAAITGVRGGQEMDLLGPALAAELKTLRLGAFEAPPADAQALASDPSLDDLHLPDGEPLAPTAKDEVRREPRPATTEPSTPTPGLTASSLEDAVMRELSEHATPAGASPPQASVGEPSIVEPRALRARNLLAAETSIVITATPSLPPEAAVPGADDDKAHGEAAPDEVLVPAAPSIPPAKPLDAPLGRPLEPQAPAGQSHPLLWLMIAALVVTALYLARE